MNWKRGFKRIALVVSVLCFAYFIICGFSYEGGWDPLILLFGLLFAALGFIAVWVVFYTGLLIVRGFRDDEPKDEQKNK